MGQAFLFYRHRRKEGKEKNVHDPYSPQSPRVRDPPPADWYGRRTDYSLGVPTVLNNDEAPAPVLVDCQLAACNGDETRIDVFARSTDGDLLHMTGNGRRWGAFELVGAPAVLRDGIAIPMGLASPPPPAVGGRSARMSSPWAKVARFSIPPGRAESGLRLAPWAPRASGWHPAPHTRLWISGGLPLWE